jgi:hypothetical protein
MPSDAAAIPRLETGERDPMTPLIAALVQVAREVAPALESWGVG